MADPLHRVHSAIGGKHSGSCGAARWNLLRAQGAQLVGPLPVLKYIYVCVCAFIYFFIYLYMYVFIYLLIYSFVLLLIYVKYMYL